MDRSTTVELALRMDPPAQRRWVSHRASIPESASSRAIVRTLSRMGFFRALEGLGVDYSGALPNIAPVGLAAFQPFATPGDLATYERSLATGRIDDLLGGGSDMEIVSSGDFREILLHELGENAFLHGRGKAVRFLIAELPPREKPDRGGFEVFFDGRATVEIVVVSDDGPGLVSTLKPRLPNTWSLRSSTIRLCLSAA